jgi:6,7-dimethyl-8-ribityllumazine synthase
LALFIFKASIMATKQKTPSQSIEISELIKDKKIGIVVAEWNKDITSALLKGAEDLLTKAGIEWVSVKWVPGSFELPLAAQYMMEFAAADAVICIGCLVKGDTPHFHYISEAVTNSISSLGLQYGKPVVFGVLTVDTIQQAQDRAGGHLGNKGEEAAIVALQMLQLKEDIKTAGGRKKVGFGK